MDLAGIGSLIGGVAGLFSKKKGAPSARENTVKLAQGARQAAERYGFNPLTMLGAGSSMGGGGGGGDAPPLASIQMLTEGLRSVDDVISGDADRRRQADQLQLDLAKVQLEQARSGVIASGPTAADGVGGSLSPLGAPRGTYAQNTVRAVPARYSASSSVAKPKGKFSQGENPVAPGRKDDIAPLSNAPGVFEIQNAWTGGKPVTIPGEGEPWGIDELATAAVFGLPQMGWNRLQGGDAKEKRQRLFDQMDKIDAEKKQERDKRRKENSARNVFVSPNSPNYRKGAY